MPAKKNHAMPGKKLLQSWVDEDVHRDFVALAGQRALKPATYLRQIIHGHVEEARKASQELGDVR